MYSKIILTLVDICTILYSSEKVHSGGVRALPLFYSIGWFSMLVVSGVVEDEPMGRDFVSSVVRPDHDGYNGVSIKRRGCENKSGAIIDVVYHGTSESFFVGYSLRESFLCYEWNLGAAANSDTKPKEVKPLFGTEKYFKKVYSSISRLMMPETELSITYRDTPLVICLG